MSTSFAAYQQPQVTRFGRASPTGVSTSIMHPVIPRQMPPFAAALKTISHTNHKPNMPPLRQDFVRHSGGNAIVLPKLNTNGRNRSLVASKTDLLSPVRQHGGSLSVRNNHHGPAHIISEAKMASNRPSSLQAMPPLPPNAQLKNFTALELSRFIDKRLTDVSKSNINYGRQNGDDKDMIGIADDQQGQKLRAKLFNSQIGRKEIITNLTNFRDIENPFADTSLTLQTIKKEKHQAWKVRKTEKSLKLKNQIVDMERKLDIYRRYKDEMGVTLNKKEREKVLKNYDSTGVEILMGRKMFTMRQIEAAIRIQSWWRMIKMRAWFGIITKIRWRSVMKIQRAWKNFMMLRVWPVMLKGMKENAAIVIQSKMKGFLTRKRYWHEISLYRMNNCFEHFQEIQHRLQKGAILFIIRHWRKFLIRRKEERKLLELEAEEAAKNASFKKKKTIVNANNGSMQQRKGSITKTERAPSQKLASQKPPSAAPAKSTNSKNTNSQKSDNAFLTGLKKEDSEVSKSKKSLHKNEQSQESLHKSPSQNDQADKISTVTPVEKLNLINCDVVQSQEDLRLKATSPLDVEMDHNMKTQDLKTMTFQGDEAVIHEVDEEQNPEELSVNRNIRHSILIAENEQADQSSADSNSKAGAEVTHSIVKKSNENPIEKVEMNETFAADVPAKLDDQEHEDQQKRVLLQDMASTGEVAVEKSLGLNTQEEAMELAATTQAADEPNIPQLEVDIVPPQSAVVIPNQEEQQKTLSVQRHSQVADSNRMSQIAGSQKNSQANFSQEEQSPMQFGHNFSQDKISLGATDQPAQTIIPGKLDEEQQEKDKPVALADLAKLNEESEMGRSSQAKDASGAPMSPDLSKRSSKNIKSVQKSQQMQQMPRNSQTLNKSTNSKKSQPASGSFKLKKSDIAFSNNQNSAAMSFSQKTKKQAPIPESTQEQQQYYQEQEDGEPRQGTESRNSVKSRQSVRELAQKRPMVAGEEKDEKVSAHQQSQNQQDDDFETNEPVPRTSFTTAEQQHAQDERKLAAQMEEIEESQRQQQQTPANDENDAEGDYDDNFSAVEDSNDIQPATQKAQAQNEERGDNNRGTHDRYADADEFQDQ